MSEQSEYVDIKEACKILGVSRQTLDNLVKRGELTRYELRTPKRTMYRRSSIEALKQVRLKPKS
jgi:excisionase family DNA binding protein